MVIHKETKVIHKFYTNKKTLKSLVVSEKAWCGGWDTHPNLPVKDSSCILTILPEAC
jgi:hypothetical protein